MQRRIRPIHGPRDVSMFHRIEVDVIDAALQVVFVADQMLPIPPLPDPAFAFGDAACAAMPASGNMARTPAPEDRTSTRLNSSPSCAPRMPSSARTKTTPPPPL